MDRTELKKYYRDISKSLPSSTRSKKRIMADLQASIDAYLAENPDADFRDIQTRFGTPHAIANSYVEQLETGDVIKKLDVRKTIVLAVCSALLVALLLWLTGIIIALVNDYNSSHGHFEADPIIESEVIE